MNKFKYYFILLITTLSLFSCSKNDTATVEPLRDYAVQYATDNTDIEEYLKTYYITVVDHPSFADDQDVTFTKIPTGGTQASVWSYKDNASYPKLLSREVSQNDITYKVYYLVLREGVGEFPCNSDGLLISYKGDYLYRQTVSEVTTLSTTFFQEIKFPQQMTDLSGIDLMASGQDIIKGWKEILPQFKTGTYTSNIDGTISYNDFGAGVMFIPSGLGYYSSGSGGIPAYAPLIFSFKLYEIKRLDHDNDGISDHLEDLDGDRYMPYVRELIKGGAVKDDTDRDGIPNFYDVDDDGDNYTTKLEIKNPATGLPYLFADIPSCTSGKKNYLDATCHP
ncbi:FKBP-type peptidyl-prolyl cis-trans isomerase [Flavobacterium gawalongense]|uniref:FKBP-type peptidylprolyl isomerase n=1 Tax=Flavobacterium gawalongense TaxID=2594432 RepID=A0A553BDZ7_9FLAO|nr:FKBP-type peptidylprolyl isomerase [Flavobacterium gawalongense]TRW98913.1 FKBP-type peptidylprolyl isomerase [Flavobacterium gawalongense]TRX03502.1 FKBP-type peptidylprolyl isomerase [Flavobacterium gawalongense]TRX06465.1 FKBP-type peptidylprolyl isomerase [Flavobacterium gawalongense]TRX07290.1 FKBP-type peptidylprolyl isomerase [Flavobacterium gawalongense]TRX25006.1 FKBP-type peptidylprolyl isomerase [Flavobacterium gawalongense]